MEQNTDLTQHRTKFKVVGEAVTRTGERIVSTAQDHGPGGSSKPIIRRFPPEQQYIADHRPEAGLVYEIIPVRGSDHLLDGNDIGGCPLCAVKFGLQDNRKTAGV